MFKVGDKVVASDKAMFYCSEGYRVITEIMDMFENEPVYILNSDHSTIWYEEELRLYEEEEKMEKTFREVIRDIKEGEVWEDKVFLIYLEDDYLQIDFKGGRDSVPGIEMKLDDIFTLRREKVDFQTASKAYEEGKEIESCVSGTIFNKKKNGEYYLFGMKEVRGGWYINS